MLFDASAPPFTAIKVLRPRLAVDLNGCHSPDQKLCCQFLLTTLVHIIAFQFLVTVAQMSISFLDWSRRKKQNESRLRHVIRKQSLVPRPGLMPKGQRQHSVSRRYLLAEAMLEIVALIDNHEVKLG